MAVTVTPPAAAGQAPAAARVAALRASLETAVAAPAAGATPPTPQPAPSPQPSPAPQPFPSPRPAPSSRPVPVADREAEAAHAAEPAGERDGDALDELIRRATRRRDRRP